MKLEIKGTITHTTPVQNIGKNSNLFKMEIVISKPAPVNEFGETYGKPQHFPVQILKNDLTAMPNPAGLKNKKVHAICYLNGYEYADQSGLQYGLRLNLKELNLLQ